MKKSIKLLRLEGCGGCFQKLLNHPRLSEISEHFDIHHSESSNGHDYLFIEGGIINGEQEKMFKEMSGKSKSIVLFGSCAKNPAQILKMKEARPASTMKEEEYSLVGCSPSYEEITGLFSKIILEKKDEAINTPVCDDCQKKEINCLMLKGIECQGAKTSGNCEILCPKISKECTGCRTSLGER